MPPLSTTPRPNDLSSFVEAFESALGRDVPAPVGDFLPPPGHPLRRAVLAELVRVEMERAWSRGSPKRLEDYRTPFPELFADPAALAPVAFEEYRLRAQAGEWTSPETYRDRYDIDTGDWPSAESLLAPATARREGAPPPPEQVLREFLGEVAPDEASDVNAPLTLRVGDVFRHFQTADPKGAGRWAEAITALPEVGKDYLGFRLVAELGRGAFGRVYLAQQSDLANRPVVLKVAADVFAESQRLAQLQHTNIVPIYSYHRVGPHQAACMPYFGSTTLAHVIKGLDGRESMPASGSHFISTVNARKGATQKAAGSSLPGSPLLPAPAAPATAPGTPPASGDGPGENLRMLEGLSYVGAVLWLGARIADGLAHAHERGILHRDLKPANVLLSDDGRPMLLDFNLAADTKAVGDPHLAAVGGTLPYMAPEHMKAFEGGPNRIDARSDIYALGVILFELLTGRAPFPAHRGSIRDTIHLMVADRSKSPPTLRDANPAVSPAVESIVRKCLAPDPADRYPSARQLREDLERHLNHLPLKYAPEPSLRERAGKWVRRHPRLTSTASVAALAACVVAALAAALVVRQQNLRTFEAREHFRQFQGNLQETRLALYRRDLDRNQLAALVGRCRANLESYQALSNPDWRKLPEVRYLPTAERDRLGEDVGELLYLLARATAARAEYAPQGPEREGQVRVALELNARAEADGGGRFPRAVRVQRAGLLKLSGNVEEAVGLIRQAEREEPASARDCFLLGHEHVKNGEFRKALPFLKRATALDPESFPAWFVRGNCHDALGQFESAAECFSACIALRPESPHAWHNRGLAYLQLKFHADARADFDRALKLKPDFADAYIDRAIAREGQDDFNGAVDDLTKALEAGTHRTRVHFMRAWARERAGDRAGAAGDRAEGLKHEPTDELSWLARAEARVGSDPKAALADVEEALKLRANSLMGLQFKAHILATLGRTKESVAALDRGVELYPDNAALRAGRGVMLARLGDRAAALRDASDALQRDGKAPNLYQVAGIYALTSRQNPEDRFQAYPLLRAALRSGYGLDLVDTDEDLDPIRKEPEFVRIVEAARAMHAKGKR